MSTSGNAYPGQTPTARELEILHLISLGLDNGAIGAAVHLSQNTIKTHVKRLFTKLEVATRAHAGACGAGGVRAGVSDHGWPGAAGGGVWAVFAGAAAGGGVGVVWGS